MQEGVTGLNAAPWLSVAAPFSCAPILLRAALPPHGQFAKECMLGVEDIKIGGENSREQAAPFPTPCQASLPWELAPRLLWRKMTQARMKSCPC